MTAAPARQWRRALAAAALMVLTVAGCRRTRTRVVEGAPNVLLIVVDTQRADRLGCYGGPPGVTPFLDALAERSFVFRRAYAPSSWTRPSVASLFTSRFQSQHGVTTFASALAEDEQTLAESLKAARYVTAGFSANLIGEGFAQGFDLFQVIPMLQLPALELKDVPARAQLVRLYMLDWLLGLPEDHRRSSTFLYLQYMESHFPLVPTEAALTDVAARRSHGVPSLTRTNALIQTSRITPLTEPDLDQINDAYDAAVLTLDQELERLFSDLERVGFLDHAVVVLTADHGEELHDHGEIGHGHALYNEQVRIPLLISLPRQAAHVDVDDVVSLIDVAPTLLGLAGVETPASFEGRSLRAAMDAADVSWIRRMAQRLLWKRSAVAGVAYSELLSMSHPDAARVTPHARAIVHGDTKLIEDVDGAQHIFDLSRDPHELHAREAGPDEIATFRPALEWLAARPRPSGRPAPAAIDRATADRLRALGYVP